MTADDTAASHPGALIDDPDLARTDPELVDWFDRFAVDEVLTDAAALDPELDGPTVLLVRLAAILAAGGLAQFRVVATAAVDRGGVTPVALTELVHQAIAYVGLARAYDYLHVSNEILTELGHPLPLPGQSTTTPENRIERGQAVQARIIGGPDAVAARWQDKAADELGFERYLAGNCFGDTVGRDGLDLPTRELITFALLTGLGGADGQIRGHVNGNLNVGNTRARLLAVLTVLVPYVGHPRTLNALAAVDAVTA